LLEEVIVFLIRSPLKTMYDPKYSNHEAKGRVRSMLLKHIPKIPGKAVTLPCLNFELEYALLKKDWNVKTIECIKSVYDEQKKICKDIKGLNNFYGSTVDYFRGYRKYVNFAYLDFCSALSADIITTLVNTRAQVIGITLVMRRDHYSLHLLKELGRGAYYVRIFNTHGYVIADRIEYKGEKGTPMCTFVLHKINHNA